MKLFRPVKYNIQTQGFGDNKLSIYKNLGMDGHNGVDWFAKDGGNIHWDVNIKGKVLETHIDNKGGLGVIVISQEGDKFYKHRFWHLKGFNCKPNQILETGDLIGWADSTGMSTGTHLHRDLKKCNSVSKTLNYDNGYFGAINPNPFLENIFVLDKMKQLKQTVSILTKIVWALKKVVALSIEKQNL